MIRQHRFGWWPSFDARDEILRLIKVIDIGIFESGLLQETIQRLNDECHKHTDALGVATREINELHAIIDLGIFENNLQRKEIETLNTKLGFTKEALLETMRQLQLSVSREKEAKDEKEG